MALRHHRGNTYSNEVIKQVEYYFSEFYISFNLTLRDQILDSSDGMVRLDVICSFDPVFKDYLGLSTGSSVEFLEKTVQAVAEMLRKSTFLRISEDGKKVGRILPVEDYGANAIAVSSLGPDAECHDVESVFRGCANILSVGMLRHLPGTAVVEFSTEEEASKILKQSFELNGVVLELKTKNEFDRERRERRAKKEEGDKKAKSQSGSSGKNNSDFELDYPKDSIVAFKLKCSTEGLTEIGNNKPANESVDTPKDVSPEDLKIAFEKFGTVKSVNFEIGLEYGSIVFEDAEASEKALATPGGVVVNNYVAILESVTGEAGK